MRFFQLAGFVCDRPPMLPTCALLSATDQTDTDSSSYINMFGGACWLESI